MTSRKANARGGNLGHELPAEASTSVNLAGGSIGRTPRLVNMAGRLGEFVLAQDFGA